MKIWITGEAGCLARNLSKWCNNHETEYQVVNNLGVEEYDYWRSNISSPFKEINIFDPTLSKLIESSEADIIIHSASVCNDDTIAHPRAAIHTNIEGSYIVGEIAEKLGLPLIYLSSSEEDQSLFSTTKLAGEQIIRQTINKSIIVRPSTIYGKYDRHSPIAKMLESIKGESNFFSLNIDAIRSYVYVEDLINALNIILLDIHSCYGKTYNVSSESVSFNDIYKYMNEDLNLCPDCTLNQVDDLLGDIIVDSSEIKALGWEPQTYIKDGIKSMLNYYGV